MALRLLEDNITPKLGLLENAPRPQATALSDTSKLEADIKTPTESNLSQFDRFGGFDTLHKIKGYV